MKKTTIEQILATRIEPRSMASRIASHIRQKLLAGVLTVTPIAVTVLISVWLFQFILDARWFNDLSSRLQFGNAADKYRMFRRDLVQVTALCRVL